MFQGFVRLRRHYFGRQAAYGTAVPATRAYPYAGVPDVNRNWTDSEIDSGSIDPVAPPTLVAPDITFPGSLPQLGYNTLTQLLSAFFGGGLVPTGGGTAKTWTVHPESETIDEPELHTHQFGDDVLDDWYQLRDGFLESFEITGPEGLAALSATTAWRYGSWASTGSTDNPVSGTVPTPGLSLDPEEALIYLKDCQPYISDTFAALWDAGSKLSYALHTFTFRGSHEVDLKRTADGTQTFDASGIGPGARAMELELGLAKTADTVGVGSESDDWMSDVSVTRYIGLRFISTVLAQSPSTFYALDISMPARYYTRQEGESGQNTLINLNAHPFFESEDFEGVIEWVLVNTMTEADLGVLAGS